MDDLKLYFIFKKLVNSGEMTLKAVYKFFECRGSGKAVFVAIAEGVHPDEVTDEMMNNY